MKKLAIIFAATASLAGTALACPGHDGGKTAEKSDVQKPAPKAEQPKTETATAQDSKAAPAAPVAKPDKVSSK